MVQVHVEPVEELERSPARAEQRRDQGRPLHPGQEAAGHPINGLGQLVEAGQADGGLGGVHGPAAVGLEVAVDHAHAEIRRGHRRVLRQVAQDGRMRPAQAGLHLLRAHEDLGVLPELPVHAWATLFLQRTEQGLRGEVDLDFLRAAFHKLMLNFT